MGTSWSRWRRQTEHGRGADGRPIVDGYLVTFVEREGEWADTLDRVPALLREGLRVTIAGGVTAAEIAARRPRRRRRLGMALYTGRPRSPRRRADAQRSPGRSVADGRVDQHQRAPVWSTPTCARWRSASRPAKGPIGPAGVAPGAERERRNAGPSGRPRLRPRPRVTVRQRGAGFATGWTATAGAR